MGVKFTVKNKRGGPFWRQNKRDLSWIYDFPFIFLVNASKLLELKDDDFPICIK